MLATRTAEARRVVTVGERCTDASQCVITQVLVINTCDSLSKLSHE